MTMQTRKVYISLAILLTGSVILYKINSFRKSEKHASESSIEISSNVDDVNAENKFDDGLINSDKDKEANELANDAENANRDDRPDADGDNNNDNDDNNDDDNGSDKEEEKDENDQNKLYYKLPPQNDGQGYHLHVDQKDKPTVILLVAYYRSGSSFIGELVNNHPDIFYFFEPLFSMDHNRELQMAVGTQFKPEKFVLQKLQLLEALFQCNVTADWGPQPEFVRSSAAIQRATGCSTPTAIGTPDEKFDDPCYSEVMKLIGDLGQIAKMCASYKYVAIKTIRLSIAAATAFMDHPKFDVKIIHIIRHPLAVISSQSALLKKGIRDTKQLENDFFAKIPVCHSIEEDIESGTELRSKWPNNYMMVRYEDIARNPEKLVKDIYNFLKISNNKEILDWVSVHTQYDKGTHGKQMPRTSKQDSAATSQQWKFRFANVDPSLLTLLESECSNAIEAGNYSKLQTLPVPGNPAPIPHHHNILNENIGHDDNNKGAEIDNTDQAGGQKLLTF